jgi:hypothetical protein
LSRQLLHSGCCPPRPPPVVPQMTRLSILCCLLLLGACVLCRIMVPAQVRNTAAT